MSGEASALGTGVLADPLVAGIAGALVLVVLLIAFAIVRRPSLLEYLRGGGAGKVNPAAGAVDDDEDAGKPKVTILFGTQTGTAERFSKQLKSDLLSRYGKGNAISVVDLEEYSGPEQLADEKLVFFMVATYGDGEPTDNAADFYGWLLKSASEAERDNTKQFLKGVTFGVFGLGNKQYEHFCMVGKRMHKALVALGAEPIVRRGDGDDDEDIEADFDAWREELMAGLDASEDLLAKGEASESAAIPEASAVQSYEVNAASGPEAKLISGSGLTAATPYLASVHIVRELHSDKSDRSCIHVELDIRGSAITYEAGDHVGVLPENGPEVVARAAELLDQPLDFAFSLSKPSGESDLPTPFAGPITLRTALARHADLLSPVSKQSVANFAAFAEGEDKEKLLDILTGNGGANYKEWHGSSKCLLELMEEFPNVKPSIGAFFGSIAPRLQVRFYSISSSPKQHPGHLHITCAVVHEKVGSGRLHEGVASYFLKRAAVGTPVPVFVRHSTFRLPKDTSTPIIMIGPGTGLAPFRGFLQERAAQIDAGNKMGPAILFFGCRKAEHDYIYKEELESYLLSGALTELHVAFSRDGPSKEYVQHHLEKRAHDVGNLLSDEQRGFVYVCGDAKHMAKDVHRTLANVLQTTFNYSTAEAEAHVKRLGEDGRYQKDVW